MYFVAKEGQTQSQKHRKATSPEEAAEAIAVVGIPGQVDTQFKTAATIAIAIVVMGIAQIIATIKATRRIGAWLCRNFHSFIAADFALVVRIDQRIAFSSESPKIQYRRPINLAATFRS